MTSLCDIDAILSMHSMQYCHRVYREIRVEISICPVRAMYDSHIHATPRHALKWLQVSQRRRVYTATFCKCTNITTACLICCTQVVTGVGPAVLPLSF
jgi:hypothetical protein